MYKYMYYGYMLLVRLHGRYSLVRIHWLCSLVRTHGICYWCMGRRVRLAARIIEILSARKSSNRSRARQPHPSSPVPLLPNSKSWSGSISCAKSLLSSYVWFLFCSWMHNRAIMSRCFVDRFCPRTSLKNSAEFAARCWIYSIIMRHFVVKIPWMCNNWKRTTRKHTNELLKLEKYKLFFWMLKYFKIKTQNPICVFHWSYKKQKCSFWFRIFIIVHVDFILLGGGYLPSLREFGP